MGESLLSVIVPCYNEVSFIADSVQIIEKHLTEITDYYEIILVDDGSVDKTFNVILNLSEDNSNIIPIRFTRNFGKEAAIFAGLKHARGKAVVIMDADLQHPPELLSSLYAHWNEDGYEVVEAVKKTQYGGGRVSKFLSLFFNYLMLKLSGLKMIGACDYKLMDRKVVDEIVAMPERNRFFRGLVNWTGYSSKQVPFEVPQRIGGNSKWSFLSLFKLSISAITSFSNIPLYITISLGLFTLIFSFGLSIHTLYNKFFGTAVSGFTTVIIIILFFSSLIMISLGIIGVYIANIYLEIKGRPFYVISNKSKDE